MHFLSTRSQIGENVNFFNLKNFVRVLTRAICHHVQVYPCFEDVASSYDGLGAGGCIPYGKATHDKQPWLINYLW
jgi:hypothetical protein